MAPEEKDRVFSDTEIVETRNRAALVIVDEKITKKAASDEAGISYTTFASWLDGKYAGNNNRITGEAHNWLVSRTEKKRRLATVQKSPCFQNTPTAKRFMEALQFAQILPEIVVIAAVAGVGKTTAVRQYQKINPNVWTATMSPSTSSPNGMMKALCVTLSITERRYGGELVRTIGGKVRGMGGVIIIDEAQHLSPLALDQLRHFYDEYGVGIALVGNETVYSRLEGDGTTAKFAQLFSRIGARVTQLKPTMADLDVLIGAWGITDSEEIRLLKKIGQKPGALRRVDKNMQLASMLAAGEEKTRGEKHIRAAFERLSNSSAQS